MPKSDTIDAILSLNPTAKPDFLAEFSNEDLHEYLQRLTFSPRQFRRAGETDSPSQSCRGESLEALPVSLGRAPQTHRSDSFARPV